MPLRLGLSSGALYPNVLTEDVPAFAAACRLSDLELLLQTAGEYQPSFISKVRASADAAGCSVRSIHSYQQLHPMLTPYLRRTEEAISLFRQGIDAVVALGGRTIVWHGLARTEATGPEVWDAFLGLAGELGRYCGDAGITLAIENVSWCVVSSVRDVMSLSARLPELGPPGSIGFTFDPFQAAEAGANPFMILAAMEGAIADVHLSDRREHDPAARHLPPGDGDLPWPALIRAIAATGYDGPMMIEGAVPNPETIERVRGLLDPLIAIASGDGDPCAGPPPAGVMEGIRLFNERRFYEAHEELEHEWHAERRKIRRLYQGILQIGVGFHHALGGNHKGAILLLTDGIEKVSEFIPTCQGIDTARLVRESAVCLTKIATLGPDRLSEFDRDEIPFLHFVEK